MKGAKPDATKLDLIDMFSAEVQALREGLVPWRKKLPNGPLAWKLNRIDMLSAKLLAELAAWRAKLVAESAELPTDQSRNATQRI